VVTIAIQPDGVFFEVVAIAILADVVAFVIEHDLGEC
jgi:hypothetical protein